MSDLDQESGKSLLDYLLALKRRKGYVFGVGFIVAIAAIILALALPPAYRSTATILIEQQEIPTDLVRSTITSFAEQRIQVISQRVMTRSNLKSIIDKYNLYAEERQDEPLETIIEQMRKDIQMRTISADVIDPRSGRPTEATIAFTLSYSSEASATAQKVANELVSLYLNENLKSRNEMVTQTAGFIGDEVNRLNETIVQLEAKLATFKEANYDRLPELAQLNMTLVQRTEQDLENVEREIGSRRERASYLTSQLAQMEPFSGLRSETGEAVLTPQDRLSVARSRLATLTGVYTDSHPEIARLRREVASLEQEVGKSRPVDGELVGRLQQQRAALDSALEGARLRYTGGHPEIVRLESEVNRIRAELYKATRAAAAADDGSFEAEISRSTNPAYVQLRAQLEGLNTEVTSLEQKRDSLRAQLTSYERRLVQSPQVEKQYRELTRDYENAWAKYREMKAKQGEAVLAQSLETERKGERFTLIEPPELPEKPVKPNRVAILVLGLVFAVICGLGVAILRDMLDERVYGRRELLKWFDISPMVTVPYIVLDEEVAAVKMRRLWIAVGAAVLVAGAAAGGHLWWKPLDVVFYAGLQRFGL